uniref:Uncharacterized protein n=1 Tax=Candidatus Kentrum sp. DK TaxID=2126562 RepID=A0A450ST70_9GAMM|nr:MAG: hypothetical protein BECKDK2373B_GA0170837_106310 [Candidatus Kentron sp. DK]
MTQAVSNETARSNLSYFRPGAFSGQEWEAAIPPSRPRTEQEERELTKQLKEAIRACQLSAKRNGIDKFTDEEFDDLVYGD